MRVLKIAGFVSCVLLAAGNFSCSSQTILQSSSAKQVIINVTTKEELQSALNNAQPGHVITLAKGIYTGQFKIPKGIDGTATQPIILKGDKAAVLQTGDINKGNGLELQGNAYWIIDGFTIQQSKKALMIDYSNNITVQNLTIKDIGEEGVHFRKFSSYNTMQFCTVTNTGLVSPGYGEACYIGSAYSNWSKYTDGKPDTCNYNKVIKNIFGPNVAAESIDVKEGTYFGYIAENIFNGDGMKNENAADSWMDVKGSNYLIEKNIGNNTLLDGFQTHRPTEGSGENNVFKANVCNVNARGYGFNIKKEKDNAFGNIVYDDNVVNKAEKGVANISLTKTKN